MKWNESESCAELYRHYFDEVILRGKVIISTPKADSLAHTLRGILTGFRVRNHVPYSSLKESVQIKVGINEVVIVKKIGSPSVEPISGKDYRIGASVSYNEVLAAIGQIKNGAIDRAAFLNVTDLDPEKQAHIEKLCLTEGFTISMSGKSIVIIK